MFDRLIHISSGYWWLKAQEATITQSIKPQETSSQEANLQDNPFSDGLDSQSPINATAERGGDLNKQ